MELPIEDIQTILHITTNLEGLSTLALKLHREIEAMKVLGEDTEEQPPAEVPQPIEETVRTMELSDL